MPKYLLCGDIHLSDKPPSSCTDSYLDDLFELLRQTVALETELQCDATVWAGDVFHVRAPSRTSHRTVQRVLELAASYKKLYVVPGNHDLATGDRLDSILDSQPLGVLFRSGAATLLQGWASDSAPLYGVPWIQQFSPEHVAAAMENWRTAESDVLQDIGNSLMVAHAPLYPPSTELSYEYYPTKGLAGWSSLMGNKGSCFYGHVHEPHGTYQVDGVTFCNNGALSRGSLHEYNLVRDVAVTTWTPESGFTSVPLTFKPASEVFRLQEVSTAVDHTVQLDSFLTAIGTSSLEVTSVEGVMAHVGSMDLTPLELSTIRSLLEAAQNG